MKYDKMSSDFDIRMVLLVLIPPYEWSNGQRIIKSKWNMIQNRHIFLNEIFLMEEHNRKKNQKINHS
jgi:hypothetical protein